MKFKNLLNKIILQWFFIRLCKVEQPFKFRYLNKDNFLTCIAKYEYYTLLYPVLPFRKSFEMCSLISLKQIRITKKKQINLF